MKKNKWKVFLLLSSSSSNFPFIERERKKETHELLLLSLFAFFLHNFAPLFSSCPLLSFFFFVHSLEQTFIQFEFTLTFAFLQFFFSTSLTNCLSFRISFFTASRKESIKSCEKEGRKRLALIITIKSSNFESEKNQKVFQEEVRKIQRERERVRYNNRLLSGKNQV